MLRTLTALEPFTPGLAGRTFKSEQREAALILKPLICSCRNTPAGKTRLCSHDCCTERNAVKECWLSTNAGASACCKTK